MKVPTNSVAPPFDRNFRNFIDFIFNMKISVLDSQNNQNNNKLNKNEIKVKSERKEQQ